MKTRTRTFGSVAVVVMVAAALFVPSRARAAACDTSDPATAATIAATRSEIASGCNCNAPRFVYQLCARDRIENSALSPACKKVVRKCAKLSTCGRLGAVTCCRTSASGETKCRIKRDASRCTAPSGGTACVGSYASCCDSCALGGGCVAPTPAPTATPSATGCCQAGPVCGDMPFGDCEALHGAIIPGTVCHPSNDPDCPIAGACGSCGPP